MSNQVYFEVERERKEKALDLVLGYKSTFEQLD